MRRDAKFIVEHAFVVRAKGVVLARLLDANNDFELVEGSTLAGCSLEKQLDIPRAHDAQGRQRYDLFQFVLRAAADVRHFVPGASVELRGPTDDPPS